MSNKDKNKDFLKPYIILASLYVTLLVSCSVYLNKLVGTDQLFVTGAALPFPFALIILDIIAEIYGYKRARTVIWTGFFCLMLFVTLTHFLIYLPSPHFSGSVTAYSEIFKNTESASLSWVIAGITGDFINAYALSKWKVLLKGRFFWLRSVGASAIGQAIYSFSWIMIIYAGHYGIHGSLTIIFAIYIYKMFLIAILAIPCTFLILLIKKTSKIDIYDYSTNFNPFKI